MKTWVWMVAIGAAACAGGDVDPQSAVPQLSSSGTAGETGSSTTEVEPEPASSSGDIASSSSSSDSFGEPTGTETSAESSGPGICPPGFADCDGSGSCAFDLASSSTCGTCDKSCELPGGALSCNAGTCEGTVELDVEDTWINSGNPAVNFGTSSVLLVDDGPNVYHALLRPADLGGIPTTATVSSATFSIVCYDAGSAVDVLEVTSDWDVAIVDWNTRPTVGAILGSFDASEGSHAVDITTTMRTWVMAGAAPRGIQMQTSGAGGSDYHSSEAATPPRFTVGVSY